MLSQNEILTKILNKKLYQAQSNLSDLNSEKDSFECRILFIKEAILHCTSEILALEFAMRKLNIEDKSHVVTSSEP